MSDIPEFDPYDHRGEIVYQLRAICATQETDGCLELSEAYLHSSIHHPATGDALFSFEEALAADGWTKTDDGWSCPECATLLARQEEEEEEEEP